MFTQYNIFSKTSMKIDPRGTMEQWAVRKSHNFEVV